MRFLIGWYVIGNKLPKLFKEANVMCWANLLLTLAYEYIDHCILNSSKPLPFDIPCLQFVEASLVISYQQVQPGQKSKSTSPWAEYLVEELITDDFLQYIHNMDCNPMLDPEEPSYTITEFLACMQHIQYAKTASLTLSLTIKHYSSTHLLLVHCSLVSKIKDSDIFRDGNIELVVSKFEKEHICNNYCIWDGFKLQHYIVAQTGMERETSETRELGQPANALK
ncbi:hypothetical protein BDR07DRAFT_1268020 [Suillus spraguei]|nr:hypothetical protein BDR07DRAFT_1268020 [Suillus spraguei]